MTYLVFGIVLILFDRLTKNLTDNNMYLGQTIEIVPNIFSLTYVQNKGAAFGILENQTVFFIIVAIILISGTIYYFPRIATNDFFMKIGTIMLLSGAIGNLIDRIIYGYVIDFLDFLIWPVFNIADIAIVLGVGSIMYSTIFLTKVEVEK